MAKALIFLLGVLVVLNGMTFLVVVNQAPPGSHAADAAGKSPKADASDKRLERIEELVGNLQKTVGNLSVKVDGLPSKVSQSVQRSSPAVSAPAVAQPESAPAPKGRGRTPPRVRTSPADFSRHTDLQGAPPAAAPDPAEETTDAEGPGPAGANPNGEAVAPNGQAAQPDGQAAQPDGQAPQPSETQPATGAEGQEGAPSSGEVPAEGTQPAGTPSPQE